jgi:sarcosine oxidase gamma subunit
MPKFLFEVFRNGQSLGDAWVDVDNLSAMRREALKALSDVAVDEIATSELDETLTVVVHNENGKPAYSATLNVSQPLAS